MSPGASAALAAVLVVAFFLPLAWVYGSRLARRIGRQARENGRDALSLALPKLALPLIAGPAMLYSLWLRGDSLNPVVVATGWRTADAALALLDTVGSAAAILFFVTIPFVLGRVFAVAALGLGWFAAEPETARAKAGPGEEGEDVREGFTIAIDGPAAAGKGTLAKRLSAHYGLPYLDTGLLYRAVGRLAADGGIDLDDAAAAGRLARELDFSALDDGSLRGREAGELASRVAVHPEVRAALEAFQRAFAARPEGAVLDGRDIGTVIAPDADVKIFVTASAEVRARRRTDELAAKGRAPDYGRILAEVRERDARDAGRAAAPLRAAPDAHLLDTSELDIDQAFAAGCRLIDNALSRRNEV